MRASSQDVSTYEKAHKKDSSTVDQDPEALKKITSDSKQESDAESQSGTPPKSESSSESDPQLQTNSQFQSGLPTSSNSQMQNSEDKTGEHLNSSSQSTQRAKAQQIPFQPNLQGFYPYQAGYPSHQAAYQPHPKAIQTGQYPPQPPYTHDSQSQSPAKSESSSQSYSQFQTDSQIQSDSLQKSNSPTSSNSQMQNSEDKTGEHLNSSTQSSQRNMGPQTSFQPHPAGFYQYQAGYPPRQAAYQPYPTAIQTGQYPPQPAYVPRPPSRSMVEPGRRRQEQEEEEEPEGWSGFTNRKVRALFIRKVYCILTLQLLVTIAIIALFVFEPNVKQFVKEHSYLYYMAIAIFTAVYMGLLCFVSVRRNFPTNIIMLIIYTLAMSYMLGTVSSFHDTEAVLMAAGICAVVCLVVTLFSFHTKFDFTSCDGVLCILLLVLIAFGIIAIIVKKKIMTMIYASVGTMVFILLLAYNTQMLMGGKKFQISPEEYVFAAIQIYIDIVNIFLHLLVLIGQSKE